MSDAMRVEMSTEGCPSKVYKCENPGVPLRVYWIWYSDSIEQKRYQKMIERVSVYRLFYVRFSRF